MYLLLQNILFSQEIIKLICKFISLKILIAIFISLKILINDDVYLKTRVCNKIFILKYDLESI